VERACAVPQLVLGCDQAMTDQTTDREPVACGESEVLPSVLTPHGRVVLDPACEEVVCAASVFAREHGEREVVCIDVLDMIERLAECRHGLEGGLNLSRTTSTGPVYNGDEHAGRTRGGQKNVCACAMNAREATEPVPS